MYPHIAGIDVDVGSGGRDNQIDRQLNRETKGKEQGRGKRRRKERVAQLIDWRKWRYSKMASRLKE